MDFAFLFFALLLFFILLTAAQDVVDPTATPTTCDLVLPTPFDPPAKPKVIDGFLSPPLPYIASVFRRGYFTCSGSVLSPNTVLTAAHCIGKGSSGHEYFVRIGAAHRENGTKIRVESIQVHPKYQPPEYQFDAAVLFLLYPIPNSTILRVEADPGAPVLWSYARIIGYGVSLIDELSDGYLRRGDIPISPCSWVRPGDLNREEPFKSEGLACSGGYTVSNCSGCYGDSGGPWVQYDTNGAPAMVGISSAATFCGATDSVTIFVRPGSIVPWLNEIGANHTLADKPLRNVFLQNTPSPRPSPSISASASPDPSLLLIEPDLSPEFEQG